MNIGVGSICVEGKKNKRRMRRIESIRVLNI
jgi:hypothetical protein